ncbi:undecaprenyl diphosphate synthase [Sporobacter termitidis DSM 10068]|uniref:Isoprenyl transferase n=2 Tax=Sporobacter TaxID=44748 RepID=A0A1M5VKM3_9FIRM|nr:undecaprenyl diphosphate synthase [Sporobacter termitidis DSM 10068]
MTRLPRHIAVIMDGNGRWAKKRGLPRQAGHAVGAETFRRVATYCKNIGIEYLTVFAFSTENWKRPADEVSAIMDILEKYLHEAIATMERDRVKMKFFGDTTFLSAKLQRLIAETERISDKFEGVQVNMCVNYGGRDEILRAARAYAQDYKEKGAALTEEKFSGYMFSTGLPDPDLIIRPSGEMRLSNFLLWQAAYSEFYFTDVLWPDFSEREMDRAIIAYQSRDRRYGGVKGQGK